MYHAAKTVTDVVRRSVGSAAGHIDIASKPGAGTTVTLCLPLTQAIIDGLRVRAGHAYFVLPLKMNLVRFMKMTSRRGRVRHSLPLPILRINGSLRFRRSDIAKWPDEWAEHERKADRF